MKMLTPDIRMSQSAGHIRLEDVHMQYGQGETKVHALKGINMEIGRGEVILMKGPSGSGKTTMLQLMGALLKPTQGNVTISGQRTSALNNRSLREFRLLKIGFVFQFFNLFPTLKAWENVALALDLKGISGKPAEERSRHLLGQMGLQDRAEFRPGQLSGGQRQRVAIARALALEPEIILADEPTAALDSEAGNIVVNHLRQCAKNEDRTVVIVSHDNRIEHLVDRTILLQDGRVVGPQIPAKTSSPIFPPNSEILM